MRIALDGTPLLTPKTGVGKYTFELAAALKRLSELPKVHLSYGIHWSARLIKRENANSQGAPYSGLPRKRFRWIPDPFKKWLKDTFIKCEFAIVKPDIFHATNYTGDSHNIPLVITIHDLSYLRYPETLPAERLLWLEKYLPRSLDAARHIIADSEFVKKEINALLGIPENRITSVRLGVGDTFKPQDNQILAKRLNKFDLKPKEYILSVGTLEPRKNLLSLLLAYERLPASIQTRWPLVIVGMQGWKNRTIANGIALLERQGIIRLLGYVSDEILPFVYAGAALFVYPSIYEGFGLPPLEAMASGVPTVVSNRASLPEVVGDAGFCVDPHDVESLSQLLTSLLGDSRKRNQMIELGLERAKQFTWQACAEKTYAVYKNVLQENN
jgi:alpha-1,3-rhamnosyl/mannosyltransferase